MRLERIYLLLFVVGTVVLALGIGLGLYDSLSREKRLPVLSLTEVVATYLPEIDALIDGGQPEAAAERAELALKLLHRDQHLTRNALGRARLLEGRLEEAAEQFRLALEEEPIFAEAQNNLGIVLVRQRRMDQAVGEFREALRIDPDLQPARQNLMRLEARLEREGTLANPDSGANGEKDPVLSAGRRHASLIYRGELERLRTGFSAEFAAKMPADSLREMHRVARTQLGGETAVLDERIETLRAGHLYIRRARFAGHDGEVEMLIQLDDRMDVAGLMLRPVQSGR